MTDEQIVEALKYCSKGETICFMCPLYNKTDHCVDMLAENALDIINRQKAENDCAKAQIKICAEVIDRQDKEIEWLKKRISGRKHALFKQQEYTAELQNSLETKCDDCNNIQLTHAEHGEVIKQVKSEAYKEFAEKLKSYLLLNEKGKISVITFEDVEKILKELVGENK